MAGRAPALRVGRVDPLIVIGCLAASIAFLLFSIWRWTDARATPPRPAPNAAAPSAGQPAPALPLLSVRRTPSLVERDLSIVEFRDALAPFVDNVSSQGCVTVALDGQAVAEGNDTSPLIPASNQKLVTTAVALEVLGAGYTFTTELRGPAAVGGAIAGDVFLIGGGDPVLQTADYQRADYPRVNPTLLNGIVDQLVAAGVTSITGNVIAIDGRYDDERFPPGWSDGIRAEEAGPLGALLVDDGFLDGGKPADPAQSAAEHLVRLLGGAGISVGGTARDAAAPTELPVLASVQSVPLSVIVGDVLANSDDNAAELLLKELGTTTGALPGTRAAGLGVVTATLASWGIDTNGMSLVDGSGLDRSNLVTCDLLLGVLEHEQANTDFVNGLAVLGRSGTLATVLADHPLAGTLRGKTGSLTGVKAWSGYVPLSGGGEIAFVLLLNTDGIGGRDVPAQWGQLADDLATYPSGPTAAEIAAGL